MADFIPVSKSTVSAAAWLRPPNYGFSRKFDRVSVLIDELAPLLPSTPLALHRQERSDGTVGYQLVALLSPLAGRNLMVTADGNWLTDYVPSLLKVYPFCLMTATQSGDKVVCIDRSSGLFTEAGTPGSLPFFTEAGEPAPELHEIVIFMQYYEQRRILTQQAVDALAELKLIVPWELVVADKSGNKQEGVVKVFKIDATALQKLPADQLMVLNERGALLIAYAQLLSEPRVQGFGALLTEHEGRKRNSPETSLPMNLDALFASQTATLKFDNL